MKIKKWKERKNKEKGIILFTILSVFLIVGVFFYQSFAIFKVNTNQDLIEGHVENMGDLEFAFYIDNQLADKAPEKDKGYSLDTSSSYCKDMKTGQQISNVNWDNENWEVKVKNIQNTKTKCFLNFKKIYKETILNEAIPDLMNGRLIPVKISENVKPSDITYTGAVAGKVTKADITNETDPWYKYEEKKWANAVILKDGKTDTYQPGEEIYEGDIESYFVWIPRYQYKLIKTENELNQYKGVDPKGNLESVQKFYESIGGNKAKDHPFEIKFGSKESEEIEGYIIHPAFEAFHTNGLWVGKFETGYKGATSTEEAAKEENTNKIDKTKVIIKPNVYSWRKINVSNAFYTSYEYKRELESHMMKNTEWGAVAYLTNSIYGRCKDNQCEEVRINNNNSYITGYSAKAQPTCGSVISLNKDCNHYGGPTTLGVLEDAGSASYYSKASTESSTTGNYMGIYDMVGSAWEYVMGVVQAGENNKKPASGRSKINNSGFNGPYSCPSCDDQTETELTGGYEWPSSKYYDLYDYKNSNQQYQRGILGDVTKEVGPFYSVSYLETFNGSYLEEQVSSYNADLAHFASSGGPWFVRGGSRYNGTDAGIFAFGNANG